MTRASCSDPTCACCPGRDEEARRLLRLIDKYELALLRIADYDDESANRHLAETNTYNGFNEPISARRARRALAGLEDK